MKTEKNYDENLRDQLYALGHYGTSGNDNVAGSAEIGEVDVLDNGYGQVENPSGEAASRIDKLRK